LSDYRASVVRGNQIFSSRMFSISETANLDERNTVKATQGTCSTCHSEALTGNAPAHGWMDIGTTVMPLAGDSADLPLFKITCSASAAPHPYRGRVIYTTDPGRALTTGKCSDVGSVVMQQFRGLSARAPYFANGSAKDLGEVVDFYNRRFQMHLSAQEKQDLVNFMSVL
jgi:cytochrome c peroxidase